MKPAPSTTALINPLDVVPMRPRQIMVLVAALLLAALDGYDALSMAFVAPALAREWHLTKDVVGVLLASSLAGMAIGAIALSPAADHFGRKKVILAALSILIFGTALSGLATSVPFLAAARVLTGAGIGVMVSMTTLISAEFTNIRRRSLAVAGVATLGFPLGGVAGGLGAAAILKGATWHWVFFTGSFCGLALFVLVVLALPESPAFIIARRMPDALAKANRVLFGLGQPAMTELPLAPDRTQSRYGSLFKPDMRRIVFPLMATAILIATSSYYILNWLPQMVVDAGFTPAQGSLVSALSGVVGLLGGIGFAAFASRFPPTRVAAIAMTGAAIALVAVGLVPPVIPLFVASAGILGFCLAGTTGMLYSIMADAFPPALRASGIGLVMGAARIASAGGPALAGLMFAHGMTRAGVSVIFAVGPLIAAVLIGTLRLRSPHPGPALDVGQTGA
ncbi:MFS transporter [Sphingomonas sp. GB1N7]|uniref:MFS transporter n=1 Tax=Parasphingomonas caseinilytica TaxID=3096158 RepID=UPI002FCAECB1